MIKSLRIWLFFLSLIIPSISMYAKVAPEIPEGLPLYYWTPADPNYINFGISSL